MEELKTLKDIEQQLFVDKNNLVCAMAKEDKEGDLMFTFIENEENMTACLTNDLKQEAIKWIKETIYQVGKEQAILECRKLIEFIGISGEDLE